MDQQRVAEWIGDAFAILCVRVGGISEAERKLRLGFEAILRELGTSPLRVIARATPAPFRSMRASAADLRHILKALDACLRIFDRYAAALSPAQRQVRALVQATRHFADQELHARRKNQRPARAALEAETAPDGVAETRSRAELLAG